MFLPHREDGEDKNIVFFDKALVILLYPVVSVPESIRDAVGSVCGRSK
jgi:hypothetical protein